MLVDQLVQVVDVCDAEEAGLALEFADERKILVPGVDSVGDDEDEDGFGVVGFVGFGGWGCLDREVVGYVVDGHFACTAVSP